MKHAVTAGLLLVALATSALGVQSQSTPPVRAAHVVTIFDVDGTVLRGMTLWVARLDERKSLQTYAANECGSFEIPAQFTSGQYCFEIRCKGMLVRTFEFAVESTFEVDAAIVIRFERDGAVTVEYSGGWRDALGPPNKPVTTVPYP